MLAQPGDNLDLDLSRLLGWLSVLKNLFQYLRIHHERLDIVPHRLNVDVLVDEFDGLGPQSMPEQSAVAAGRLHRFINLCQPTVIFLITTYSLASFYPSPNRPNHRYLSAELFAPFVFR